MSKIENAPFFIHFIFEDKLGRIYTRPVVQSEVGEIGVRCDMFWLLPDY